MPIFAILAIFGIIRWSVSHDDIWFHVRISGRLRAQYFTHLAMQLTQNLWPLLWLLGECPVSRMLAIFFCLTMYSWTRRLVKCFLCNKPLILKECMYCNNAHSDNFAKLIRISPCIEKCKRSVTCAALRTHSIHCIRCVCRVTNIRICSYIFFILHMSLT